MLWVRAILLCRVVVRDQSLCLPETLKKAQPIRHSDSAQQPQPGMPATVSVPTEFKVHRCFTTAVSLRIFQGDLDNNLIKQTVAAALLKGYRDIDTAAAYKKKGEVGEAPNERGLPRKLVFIMTKL